MALTKKAFSLIKNQNGVVTRKQLIDTGNPVSRIRSLLKREQLIFVKKGLYRLNGVPNTWRQRAIEAVLGSGLNARLSHESVLQLFNLLPKSSLNGSRKRRPVHRRNLIHVVLPREEHPKNGVFYHRSIHIDLEDGLTCNEGIPHVSIERAIIDCSQALTSTELFSVIDKALARNLISVQMLLFELDRLGTAPGRERRKIKMIAQTFANSDSGNKCESTFERRVFNLIAKKFPQYKIIPQYEVTIYNDQYRLDFALPELKIAVEADGFAYHRHRAAFDKDRKRQNDLISDGWVVIRLTTSFTNEEIIRTLNSIVNVSVGDL